MGTFRKSNSYLLLTDKTRCPKCFAKTIGSVQGYCRNCGTKYFLQPTDDFERFEMETGTMYWWCWHPQDGWKHRDHWMIDAIKPLDRGYTPPEVPKDYNKHITPADVANAPMKMRQNRLKVLK